MINQLKSVVGVVAWDLNRGIGHDGKLPWEYAEDLAHFKKLTKGGTVIMGYNTWKSIGCRPLPHRMNIVLSKNEYRRREINERFTSGENVAAAKSLLNIDRALTSAPNKTFVIGGAQIYQSALSLGLMKEVIVTEILETHEVDTYFPLLKGKWYSERYVNEIGFNPLLRYQRLWKSIL